MKRPSLLSWKTLKVPPQFLNIYFGGLQKLNIELQWQHQSSTRKNKYRSTREKRN